MASERWFKGFTPDGIPIVHYENDGAAFLRCSDASDDPMPWEELPNYGHSGTDMPATDPYLLREAVQSAALEAERKNFAPLMALGKALTRRG